jgi:hypothetical protein
MLVASNISKRDAGDAAARDLLEIERPPTPGKNLHIVSIGSYQMNWSSRDKNLIFVDSRANKDLVVLSRIE